MAQTLNSNGEAGDFAGGESVKVAVRIRPMNALELSRGDEQCIKSLSDSQC
jgi:hypothetical protein